MGNLNIEIKAKYDDHEFAIAILERKKAVFKGLDHQIDTYFNITNKNGRLKLREGNIENSLIYYEREDIFGPKKSLVKLVNFPSKMHGLKEILICMNNVLIEVEKVREIWFMDNVKIHLDNVYGLGRFLEIEAIDQFNDIGQSRLEEQCSYYAKLFGVNQNNLINISYSDMLLIKNKKP